MSNKKITIEHYDAEKYIRLVENSDDPILKSYMKNELEVISKTLYSSNKTFIDLGAGYGRILPIIAKMSRDVISVEINPNMLTELRKRAKKYRNAIAVEGDIQKLSDILKDKDVKKPVLLLLQNTLGVVENEGKEVLDEMKSIAKKYDGEIIISLFRKESLKDWGLKMFSGVKEMVGEPDLQRTDYERGIFVSKTGYESKWWSCDEIRQIKEFFDGKLINEVSTPQFYIAHIKI